MPPTSAVSPRVFERALSWLDRISVTVVTLRDIHAGPLNGHRSVEHARQLATALVETGHLSPILDSRRDPMAATRARARVTELVLRGVMRSARGLLCVDCGHMWEPGGPAHEYDHFAGYGPEHALDVEPVCKPCHVAREQRRGATGGRPRGPRYEINPKLRAGQL